MQGKDVQAASENKRVYRDLASASADSLLCGPLHGDIQENAFWGARALVAPTTLEINVLNDITLTADLTGASADSSLCSQLHDYQEEHWECALMSPNLYNSQKSMSNLGIANVD